MQQRSIFSGKDYTEYKLACAPLLLEAPNGDLLCEWLSGGDDEPADDNCVLVSRSTDRGQTWSRAEVLLPAGDMAAALTSWHTTQDGRIIMFGAHWPYDKTYNDWYYFRCESTDSGKTWSKPEKRTFHNNHSSFGSPIRLNNGELLFAGTFFKERENPLVGTVKSFIDIQNEQEASLISADKEKNEIHKFGTHLHGCCIYISSDENAMELVEYGHIANRPLGLLEPSCIQLRDGKIVMMMRAEWGGYLWRAESSDNGRTWTDAWQTDIPNPTTCLSLVRLLDGRIAMIHNATGKKGEFGTRNPMSIWISNDEMETWSIQEDVIATSDNYRPDNRDKGLDELSYPMARIIDGRLYFVYDRNRRQVMFVEIDME